MPKGVYERTAEHKAAISAGRKGQASPQKGRGAQVETERLWCGYVKVKCPDGRWRKRSHLVWEEANGPIPPGHLIHHENEDKQDDRLENLRLMTKSQHARHHKLGRRHVN